MRKVMALLLITICMGCCFSQNVHADTSTYGNKAVIRFYQGDEPTSNPSEPESIEESPNNSGKLPQTGSKVSFYSFLGIVIIWLVWIVRRRTKSSLQK